MRLTRACKHQQAAGERKPGERLPEPRDSSGIALFMVIAAISVLSIIVTEFSYIAQVNERMAFDSLDQVKAHYLAKSGLKLSLLRLKAYAMIKATMGGGAGGANGGAAGGNTGNPLAGAVPKAVLEKIWSFPFMYPLPDLPDMTVSQKEQIQEFEKSSNLQGHYSAVIESQDSKYNLNSLIQEFATPNASPSPSASSGANPAPNPSQNPGPNPSPSASGFNAETAREGLQNFLQTVLTNKVQDDEDFAHDYRDFDLTTLVMNIAMWEDRTYNVGASIPDDQIPPKRAPFYSLTELHMIPALDDQLYDLFSPLLTVNPTTGINVNTMDENVLHNLVPGMTPDEIKNFFTFRDDPTTDNLFKQVSDFTTYLTQNVQFFRGDKDQVSQWQQQLQNEGVHLVTDDQDFKITVQAQVNQAMRTFQVWVTVTGTGTPENPLLPGAAPSGQPSPPPYQALTGPGGVQASPVPDSGLKITFMRVL